MIISSQKLVQNLRLQDEHNNKLKAWINKKSKLPHTLADDDKEQDQASMLLDSDTNTK